MDTEEIVYKVDVSELEDNVRKTAEAVEASVAEIGESYRKIDFSVWDTDLLSALKHINDLKAAMEEVEAAMDSGDEEAQKEARQNLDEAVDRFAKGMAGAGMGDLGKAFEFAAENLQKIVDMSGDERMSETADALSSVGQTLNAAAQGAATGGWIGAVVGAATDIASQIGEALTAARVEEEEYLKNREDFLREYAKQNLQLMLQLIYLPAAVGKLFLCHVPQLSVLFRLQKLQGLRLILPGLLITPIGLHDGGKVRLLLHKSCKAFRVSRHIRLPKGSHQFVIVFFDIFQSVYGQHISLILCTGLPGPYHSVLVCQIPYHPDLLESGRLQDLLYILLAADIASCHHGDPDDPVDPAHKIDGLLVFVIRIRKVEDQKLVGPGVAIVFCQPHHVL